MKRTFLLLLSAEFVLTLLSSARADSAADARKALRKTYAGSVAAALKNDAAASQAYWLRLCTPDYTRLGTARGDIKTLRDLEKDFNATAAQRVALAPKVTRFTETVRRIAVRGDTAVARVDTVTDFVYTSPKTHRRVSNHQEQAQRDTWIKTPDGWRLKRTQILRVREKQK